MNIQELIQSKREEILQLASQHGACNVRIFGSVVRGEADKKSDIDFLVDLGQNLSPWFPVRLIRPIASNEETKVMIERLPDIGSRSGFRSLSSL